MQFPHRRGCPAYHFPFNCTPTETRQAGGPIWQAGKQMLAAATLFQRSCKSIQGRFKCNVSQLLEHPGWGVRRVLPPRQQPLSAPSVGSPWAAAVLQTNHSQADRCAQPLAASYSLARLSG